MVLQQHLADTMKKVMLLERLTILGVANKAGIAKSSAQDYLHGLGNPRADTIELICENLGCPLTELFDPGSQYQSVESPDFLSLKDHNNPIHPKLKNLVYFSYLMAKDILVLNEVLYRVDAEDGGEE